MILVKSLFCVENKLTNKMLSRISTLPKLSGFARHLSNNNQVLTSKNTTSNDSTAASKPERKSQSSSKPVQPLENKHQKTTAYKASNSHLINGINKHAFSNNKFFKNNNPLKPVTNVSIEFV